MSKNPNKTPQPCTTKCNHFRCYLNRQIEKNPNLPKEMREAGLKQSIALTIEWQRKERGLTQAKLAEMVGTKQPHIARIERGDYFPSTLSLFRIAEALGFEWELKMRQPVITYKMNSKAGTATTEFVWT